MDIVWYRTALDVTWAAWTIKYLWQPLMTSSSGFQAWQLTHSTLFKECALSDTQLVRPHENITGSGPVSAANEQLNLFAFGNYFGSRLTLIDPQSNMLNRFPYHDILDISSKVCSILVQRYCSADSGVLSPALTVRPCLDTIASGVDDASEFIWDQYVDRDTWYQLAPAVDRARSSCSPFTA